jgi:hypothetical protein
LTRSRRVLLLSAGGPVGIGTTRSLQETGHYVIGTDCSPDGRALSVADETHPLPAASWDRGWPGEDYAKALHKLIWQLKPDLVHAQTDVEVRALSRFRNVVKPARYMLPSHDTVCACQDKWLSWQRWKKARVSVPDTYLIRGREAIFNFLAKYGEGWIRFRQGGGAAGSLRTGSYVEAVEWVKRHDGWGDMTIAQVLTGESVTWQSLWVHGEPVACQQRRRLSWTDRSSPSGVGGSTLVGETMYDPAVGIEAERACRAIDPEPHGLFGVDLTAGLGEEWGYSGVYCPTEVNVGRFHTTIEFFTRAGFNFPDLYLAAALGWPFERALNPLRAGRRWIRCMDREPVLA